MGALRSYRLLEFECGVNLSLPKAVDIVICAYDAVMTPASLAMFVTRE